VLTSFQILGPVTVVDSCGKDVTPRSAHRRALLADLIIHANQVMSVDRLLDDLWGTSPPLTARSSLHNLVSQLRKTLGAETVITRGPGYAILIQPEQLDSVCFERLVHRASGQEPRNRVPTLGDALALWQGDQPLLDVLYEEFAQPAIRRLGELRSKAIEDLCEARLAAAEGSVRSVETARELLPDLCALVAAYPDRDRFRSLLVTARGVSEARVEAPLASVSTAGV
jgi:DNA-binding SARP family transcriptional activator